MLAAGVACVVSTGRPPRAAIDAALSIELSDATFAANKPSGFAAALVAVSMMLAEPLRVADAAVMSGVAAEALLAPGRNHRSRVDRITGSTGKSIDGERVADGSV
jgi:hypothetical protein